MRSSPYAVDRMFPVEILTGDAHGGINGLGRALAVTSRNVCTTHVTAIPRNNGSAIVYFDERRNYDMY